MSAEDDCSLPNRFMAARTATPTPMRARFAAAVVLLLALPYAAAQDNKPTQYDVEAVYLYNFAKFVTWPQTGPQRGPFTICVFGEDPIAPILDRTIAGETLDGRPVVDRKVSTLEQLPACSILYISASQAKQVGRVLAVVQGLPVLTVSDMPGFLAGGGIIQFVLLDNRVRFEVNLQPTQRDGLALSSELLKVALNVKEIGSGR